MMIGCDMWSGHTPSPPVAAVVTLRPEAGLPLIQVTTVPDDEKDTGLVPYSKPWLWLCICSACQLPASRSAPSTQFRKGRGPAEKPFNPMEFSKSRARFRAWALGQEREAGAWKADSFRRHTHSGVYVSGIQTSATNGNSLHLARNIGDSVATGGVETAPQHIWQPIIIYLGRPR